MNIEKASPYVLLFHHIPISKSLNWTGKYRWNWKNYALEFKSMVLNILHYDIALS